MIKTIKEKIKGVLPAINEIRPKQAREFEIDEFTVHTFGADVNSVLCPSSMINPIAKAAIIQRQDGLIYNGLSEIMGWPTSEIFYLNQGADETLLIQVYICGFYPWLFNTSADNFWDALIGEAIGSENRGIEYRDLLAQLAAPTWDWDVTIMDPQEMERFIKKLDSMGTIYERYSRFGVSINSEGGIVEPSAFERIFGIENGPSVGYSPNIPC